MVSEEFVFPEDAHGWLTPAEGRALATLATGKCVLEIGAWCGRSTICLAQTAAIVHSVDHHTGDRHTGHRDTLSTFLNNLGRYRVAENVVVHKALWEQIVPSLQDGHFDLVFVDHKHDRASVEAVIETTRAKLAPHGVWGFHDYANPDYPGVRAAVDPFIAERGFQITVVDTMAVVETNTPPTLSAIVPTVSRPTLKRTLESIADQRLLPGDEVLVIGDGKQPDAESMFHDSGLPGIYLSMRGPKKDWGNASRNEAMRRAKGQYLLYIDDDDFYTPDAFLNIRRALADSPGRPHMFRMSRPSKGDVLWRAPEVRRGNVGTQIFIHPNRPERTGEWGLRYAGDYDFIISTLARWPSGSLVWREEIIAVWGRE